VPVPTAVPLPAGVTDESVDPTAADGTAPADAADGTAKPRASASSTRTRNDGRIDIPSLPDVAPFLDLQTPAVETPS